MSDFFEMAAEHRALFRRDRELPPPEGWTIAEFANGRDARLFALAKGEGYTITAGVNLPYAVRYLP
jgi:hypothetical protein